jgi:hypothetical protein
MKRIPYTFPLVTSNSSPTSSALFLPFLFGYFQPHFVSERVTPRCVPNPPRTETWLIVSFCYINFEGAHHWTGTATLPFRESTEGLSTSGLGAPSVLSVRPRFLVAPCLLRSSGPGLDERKLLRYVTAACVTEESTVVVWFVLDCRLRFGGSVLRGLCEVVEGLGMGGVSLCFFEFGAGEVP